jgi:hypothetical protein
MNSRIDISVLKKEPSKFYSPKGSLMGVPPEVLYQVLNIWESWNATSKEFYSSIDVSQKQMSGLLGKAKKLLLEVLVLSAML